MTDSVAAHGEEKHGKSSQKPDYLTTGELIRLLSDHPPDLRVVVDGYEGGYDDLSVRQLQRIRIALGVGEEDWYGDHDEPDLVFPEDRRPTESVEALVLRRRSG